ncbi:MAG: AAA family ATPase [Bdellovibrionota bacterium]
MSLLTSALNAAKRGLPVFPLTPESKEPPLIKDFPNYATTNPEQIKLWWETWPDANIAISTDHFLAIDIDIKNGKNGFETIETLKREGFVFPPTFTQTTPTGGQHLIYRATAPIKQGVNVLGDGVDIRGFHGYLVGSGSYVGGKVYSANNLAVVLAPEWLISRCSRAKEPNPLAVVSLQGINVERAIERATKYLLEEAPPAIEGLGGNTATFRVACRVKDFGVAQSQCFELMSKFYNGRCIPAWEPVDLQKLVRNAFTYGTDRPGLAAPEIVFQPTPTSQIRPPNSTKPRIELIPFKEISLDTSATSLVQNLLDQGTMGVVYGASNTGKSFFVLDLALHIALGRKWMNRMVTQGAVVYVAAEGGRAFQKRIVAFKKFHNLEGPSEVPFFLVPSSVNLLDPEADRRALIQQILAASKDCAQPLKLLVIDTLSRAISGGNENASEDMTAFIESVDAIRQATGATVVAIHHSGKDTAKGARGHSSLRAATDTEVEIEMTDKERRICRATIQKQRDRDLGKNIEYQLTSTFLGSDANGEPISSAVVIPFESGSASIIREPEGKWTSKALAVLKDLLNGSETYTPTHLNLPNSTKVVKREEWRLAFKTKYFPYGQRQSAATAFKRAERDAYANSLYQEKDDYVWI